MNTLNIAAGFVEGIGLVLSPCILPILPIMLAASLDGGKRRPLGIITGFIVAFTGLALLSRQLLDTLHADPDTVRKSALVFLIMFGVVMLSQKLSDKLLSATTGLANAGQNLTSRWDQKNGFFSGMAVGALIGLIWSPCAGPIMAAAIVSVIQAKDITEAGLTILMFALGAGIPMLVIALAGRSIMSRLSFLKTHSHLVRQILGVIIIIVAVAIYEGVDVRLLAQSGSPASQATVINADLKPGSLIKPLDNPYPAPELASGQTWLNSDPLTLKNLKGKVVLVDFWTYSCINCVRTLPYITAWDAKYRDRGLVIIGIHSPEFGFEKNADNVKAALEKYGIHYPVTLDNDLANWDAFHNRYWPAHYLIDRNGNVVYTHFGEGDYDITENNIRTLLGIDTPMMPSVEKPQAQQDKTPETYLGYGRAERQQGNAPIGRDTITSYQSSGDLALDHWQLNGKWKIEKQKITSATAGAELRLHFHAKKVFLVAGKDDNAPTRIEVSSNTSSGTQDNTINITGHTLYQLLDLDRPQEGTLTIKTFAPGIEFYAFTFGN